MSAGLRPEVCTCPGAGCRVSCTQASDSPQALWLPVPLSPSLTLTDTIK